MPTDAQEDGGVDRPSNGTIRGNPDLGLPRPNLEYRYSIQCACGKRWSPSVAAGFSRHAGTPSCPECGTDYRVWAMFAQMFGGDHAE